MQQTKFIALSLLALCGMAVPASRGASITYQFGTTPGYTNSAAGSTDARARSDTPTQTNGDSTGVLLVGQNGATEFQSFVSFNLSTVPTNATFTAASLGLSIGVLDASSNDTNPFAIDLKSAGAFTDSTVSFNNRPTIGSTLSTQNVQANTGAFQDLKTFTSTAAFVSAVQAAYASGSHTLYLAVVEDTVSGSARRIVDFGSNESGTNHPALTLTYSVPEPASLSMLALGAAAPLLRRRRA